MTQAIEGRRVDPRAVRTGPEFAAALTEVRLRAGRSIRDVARATGIPSATLGGYFSGWHLPPATQPQLLGQVLAAIGIDDPAEVQEWDEALLTVRRAGSPRVSATGSGIDLAVPGVSPYRGLEAFQEQDSALFFGRESTVSELVTAVVDRAGTPDAPRLLALVGPSGSGKSSVLRAGVVPHLRDRSSSPWAVSVFVPGVDPVGALAAARGAVADAPRVLLVVDQAEEIFAPGVAPQARRAFLEGLTEDRAADASGDQVVVVMVCLRADFYGQAASEPELLAALQSSQFILGAMSPDELRLAVLRPAESVGVSVDPALVELLMRDLSPRGLAQPSYDAGALPLVSHALLATWERHQGSTLSAGDYVAAGGIAGAVQLTAESVVAGLDRTGRAAAQWLFTQMVVVDEDGVMTRRRVRHDDLHHPDPATDLALDAVIEAFVVGRLLTAGEETLEISHEALLTAWPRLHDWVLSDLDAARLQRRIADAAAAWRERDRDPGALLRGGPLADALSLAAAPPSSARVLSAAEQEFVSASSALAQAEQQADRRREKRLRALVGVMTALALLAGTLAGVAVLARNEAQVQEQAATQARDEALSRQLAITANDLRASDPALAAQLALAAYEESPTVQAVSSLLSSTGVATPTRYVGPVGEMRAVANPDGTVLAISGADGVTRLWRRSAEGDPTPAAAPPAEASSSSATDPATGREGYVPIGELPAVGGDTSIYGSAFSPDGMLFAAGSADGTVVLWDVADISAPEVLATLEDAQASVQSLAFSGDGAQLAVGTSEPAVRRWSLTDGTPRALKPITDQFAGMVKSVAYSPDGSLLATGSADGAIRIWTTPTTGSAALLSTTSVGDATNFVHSVAFSPDGQLLASGEKGRLARLWDVSDPSSPTPRGEPLEEFSSWVNTVGFSPDGQTLVAGSSDGFVKLFAVDGGQVRTTLPNPAAITNAQFVGTGAALLTSEVDGVARLWPIPGPTLGGFTDSVWSIFQDDAESVLGVGPGAGDGSVHLFDQSDPSDPKPVGTLTPPAGAGPGDGAAAMSRDGRWVAAGTATGHVAVWGRQQQAGPYQLVADLTASDQLVEVVAFSPEGSLLAAIADDGAVRVWALEAGSEPQLVHSLQAAGLPLGLAFAPDSSLLAVATTEGHVHLWRLGGSSSGSTDAGAAEELPVLTGFENYAYGVAFDPTGRYLAAGSTDRTVRIWDLTDPAAAIPVGEPIRGPGDTIYALDWSSDGQVLSGVSKDGSVWLWKVADPSAPTLYATLKAGDGSLYSVAFRSGGSQVSAGGSSAVVSTWQVADDAVAEQTCARTGTGMSESEWQQLVPGVPYAPPCPIASEG